MRFKGFLPVGAAPPPRRGDLIETRPILSQVHKNSISATMDLRALTIRVHQPPPPLTLLPIHQRERE